MLTAKFALKINFGDALTKQVELDTKRISFNQIRKYNIDFKRVFYTSDYGVLTTVWVQKGWVIPQRFVIDESIHYCRGKKIIIMN